MMTKYNLGRKGLISSYIGNCPSLRGVRARTQLGTWRQEPKQNP